MDKIACFAVKASAGKQVSEKLQRLVVSNNGAAPQCTDLEKEGRLDYTHLTRCRADPHIPEEMGGSVKAGNKDVAGNKR